MCKVGLNTPLEGRSDLPCPPQVNAPFAANLGRTGQSPLGGAAGRASGGGGAGGCCGCGSAGPGSGTGRGRPAGSAGAVTGRGGGCAVTDMLDRDERADAGGGGVDAFRVLGLHYDPDLTDADVRRAYLLRVRAVHPDSGGDAAAAAAVTAAYDALPSGVRRGELLAAATVDRGDIPQGSGAGRRRGPARRGADGRVVVRGRGRCRMRRGARSCGRRSRRRGRHRACRRSSPMRRRWGRSRICSG